MALFLLGFGALFLWNTGRRDFWDPDEALVAELVRNFEGSSDWVVPRFAGGPFLDLPPLVPWLAWGVHKATGLPVAMAYRLPVCLFAILGLALTWSLGRRLFSARIGFLALLIQGSSYFYFKSAGWLDDDLIFAVLCQGALTAFARGVEGSGSRALILAGWFALAGAALAKSAPLALVLICPVLTLYWFLGKGYEGFLSSAKKVLRLPGLALFLALVAPWYVAAAMESGEALLDGQLFMPARRLYSSTVFKEPPYFYLLQFAAGFLPWTFFAPSGLLHGKDRLQRPGERLAMFWWIVPLVVLSLCSAKRPGYLLFVWPAASLLVAASFYEVREWFTVWEDFLRDDLMRFVPYVLKAPAFIVAALLAGHYSGYFQGFYGEGLKRALSESTAVGYAAGLLAGAAALCYLISGRVARLAARKETAGAAFEYALVSAFVLFIGTFAFPFLDSVVSPRAVLERFSRQVPAAARLAVYGEKRPVSFYYLDPDETGRTIVHLEYPNAAFAEDPAHQRLKDFLSPAATAYIVTTRREIDSLARLFPSLTQALHEKDHEVLGTGTELVLLSNR